MVESGQTVQISVRGACLRFGGVRALSDVSLDLMDREILAVIGPNGSGKTSLMNCISGHYHPQEGHLSFKGSSIGRMAPHKIAALGIGRTFQNVELFTGLSVLENVMAARHLFIKSGPLGQALFYGHAQNEEIRNRLVVEEIIEFLEMQSIRSKVVSILPYGLRKRVELARALALEPSILLLDELMAGMNMEEKEDIVRFVLDIFEGAEFGYESEFLRRGVQSILLVEHDIGVVMDIADRVVVLEYGRKIADGDPKQIQEDREVVRAYLGEEALSG